MGPEKDRKTVSLEGPIFRFDVFESIPRNTLLLKATSITCHAGPSGWRKTTCFARTIGGLLRRDGDAGWCCCV